MMDRLAATDYGSYYEHDFRYRWLRPAQLQDKLLKFRKEEQFQFRMLGRSVEGRPIEKIVWGKGNTRVLLWSQMHGNEPTATMALMDLLNFLSKQDKYDGLRRRWHDELEVHIILMLNPDGSEGFSRLNALGVDINRDAVRAAMPETRILLEQIEGLQPAWAFNLHDQRNIFSVGDRGKAATISFLAASADESRALTPVREKSMRLIASLHQRCEEEIPGHTGRYTDEYYPRAIGDYLHRKGIPCILIESGAHPEDPFRDVARKLNFLCLSDAFTLLAESEDPAGEIGDYEAIPHNSKLMLDVIMRECQLEREGQTFTADLGLLYREQIGGESLQKQLTLAEIGDLRHYHGLTEWPGGKIDMSSAQLTPEQPVSLTVKRPNGNQLKIYNGICQ